MMQDLQKLVWNNNSQKYFGNNLQNMIEIFAYCPILERDWLSSVNMRGGNIMH